MTLKNNLLFFHIFLGFFPCNSKNKVSDKNGFQIRILATSKNTSIKKILYDLKRQ